MHRMTYSSVHLCNPPEAISDGRLNPATDTSLLLAAYRGGSHLTYDIENEEDQFPVSRSLVFFWCVKMQASFGENCIITNWHSMNSQNSFNPRKGCEFHPESEKPFKRFLIVSIPARGANFIQQEPQRHRVMPSFNPRKGCEFHPKP